VRRVLLAVATVWLVGMGMLLALVLQPVGDSPAANGASALTVLATYNANNGQNGDVLCGPVGPAGPGAAIAAAAARAAGFTGADLLTAVAVAGAESGWRANATHLNADGSTDYGMWQINSSHATLLASGDWQDPYSNARMAMGVFRSQGWAAWSTFASGAYLHHLAAAAGALGGVAVPAANPCTAGDPPSGPDHLTPWTRAMRNDVAAHFPGHVVGCYRSVQDGGEHPLGRACDFMSDMTSGNEIAAYVQANASRLHVLYVIHAQHIWSPARAAEGWRPMADRGSITANHYDHVHVSVLP
jgi:hypothetical protein